MESINCITRNVMVQSAGLVNLLGVVISIIIVKSKVYEISYRTNGCTTL